MDQSTTTAPSLGFFSQRQELPSVTPAWLESEERLKREKATTTGDYVGSIMRQDGIVDGLMGTIVGRNMTPDPNYSPFAPKEWKGLTEGIWPEHQSAFSEAHSPAHALFIKDRLLQKQQDLTRLGDLGIPGEIGRFALGAVMPENLLAMTLGNYAAPALRLSQAARATRIAVSAGVEGATNLGFEKLRQSVNFEDNTTALLEATLIGTVMGSAFGAAGGKHQARVVNAAERERQALVALAKADAGETLTPAEHALLKDLQAQHEVAQAVEDGHMSPHEAAEKLRSGDAPSAPGERSRAESLVDEVFPGHKAAEAASAAEKAAVSAKVETAKAKWAAVKAAPKSADEVIAGEAPAKGMTRIYHGSATHGRYEGKAWFSSDRKYAENFRSGSELQYVDYPTEKLNALADPDGYGQTIEKGFTVNLELDSAETGPRRPAKAPAGPVEAPAAKAHADAPAVPHEAPKAGPELGQAVDFTNRNGDVLWGEVQKVREDGFLHIRDEDGTEHVVHQSRLQDQPSPFGPDSIGAARVASPGAGPESNLTAFSKARLDIFAVLNRSDSIKVRELAYMLVKDAIQTDAKYAQGMTATEWKSQIKRTVGGLFHTDSREALREAADAMKVPLWKRGEFAHEFHSMVSRLTRGDLTVTGNNPDIAPMLQKASAAQKRVYAKMLEELQAAGVKGADQLQPNDFYVNRVWHHENIRKAIETHGADNVYDLLAQAIKVPGVTGDKAKAKRFLDAVRRLEFSKVMQNIHLYAEDMGTLRGELAKANLAPDDIDLIVDTMFHAKEAAGSDKGRAAPMKFRFDIDENLSRNGLRIADLFENDSRVLVDTYLNTMAGHVGLAKHGIHSEAEFMAHLKGAQDEALAKNVNIDDDLRLLQDVHSNIVGRPMSTQDFSKAARVAAAMRGYSRSLNLGQLGITAAFEMKQAIGLMGFRAFWQQMPTVRQFITGLRNGHYPGIELARDVEHMVGFGNELAASYARAQEIDDGFLGQQLSRTEHLANKVSHAVDTISGNAAMTSLTRQFSSMMGIQRLHDFASGLKKLDPAMRKRLVGWGVDDHQIDPTLDSLKRHTKARAADGKVEEIDWERWLQDEPAQYQAFQTVLSRMVRDAIQDHDLGETMPFMHSTLGKVFGELKTFFFVAHAKNMLKNLHYRDSTALQVLLIGWAGEMLAYSTQASANYAHDRNKMAEMLSPDKIAMGAFFRSPVHGMLPFLAETGYQVATGGKSLVSPDMTANTGNRTFVPPALIALQRLYAAPSTAFGLVTGSGNVTRQEGVNLWKTLPLSNMLGARNLGAWLTESLPQSETRRGQ